MLTFELTPDNKTIEIHVDRQGAEELISYLQPLLEATESDHLHLFTPASDGRGLSDEKQGENNKLIHHVQLMFWPESVPITLPLFFPQK